MSKADDELFGLKSSRTGEYLHSKSADEMFEELGYEKQEDKYRIEYSLKQNFTHFIVIKRICFYKIERDIVIEQRNVTEAIKISVNITMQELKAINLKVKELRLDRRRR